VASSGIALPQRYRTYHSGLWPFLAFVIVAVHLCHCESKEVVNFEGDWKEGSEPLDKAQEMCDTTATEAQARETREGVTGGVDWLRESLVSDGSLDLLLALSGPEQLKSGKQNKQQLLLGWLLKRVIIGAGTSKHTACDTELSTNK